MKIALLGSGKTGGEVAKMHSNTVIFNSRNIPTLETLSECDIVIAFIDGEIFKSYIPLLIKSKLPVVIGATGFEWDQETVSLIKENKLKWIHSHNFSIGMSIVKSLIETISKGSELLEEAHFAIHDIHHTKKLDAPSGTALSWEKWLNKKTEITSERTGEVVGYHHLEMHTPNELIKITHEAKDRGLFASGAIWSAKQLMENEQIEYGLIHFNDLVTDQLK